MKLIMKTLTVLGVLSALATPAFAQTTIDNTTLSAAVTSTSATVINLASVTCTGCTFGQSTQILVDNEVMQVTGAYTSGTTNIPVQRGVFGTVGTHASGSVVILGPPIRFKQADPPSGSCTRTSQQFLPWVNAAANPIRVWSCDNVNWYYGVLATISGSSRPLAQFLPPSEVPGLFAMVTDWLTSWVRW